MSMSTHVVGYRKPDAKFTVMRAAWLACEQAGIEIPEDISDYFDGEKPDSAGMEIKIEKAVTEFEDDYRHGFEVDVSKLPEGLTIIRFFNSY